MTHDLPSPLTPTDCDLRDFRCMFLDVVRLFASDFHATANDAEWRAGMTLWCKSWHQVPAASLPDDETALSHLAELGRDGKAWRKVKDKALHGWVKCKDGRFYHRTVAAFALEAWVEKLGMRKSSAAGNAKRWGGAFDPEETNTAIRVAATMLAALNPQSRALQKRTIIAASGNPNGIPADSPDGIPDGTPKIVPSASLGTVSKKEETKADPLRGSRSEEISKPSPEGAHPADAKDWLFKVGLPWLAKASGKSEEACRPMLAKLLNGDSKGNPSVLRAAIEAAQADPPLDPVPWLRQAVKVRLQQSTGDAFIAAEPHQWEKRLTEFKRGGAWPTSWGGKGPGDHPGHRLATVAPVFAKHGFVFDSKPKEVAA